MLGSIALKLKGSLGMFWENLDDDERRALIFFSLYALASAYSVFSAWSKESERQRLKSELLEEIRGGR